MSCSSCSCTKLYISLRKVMSRRSVNRGGIFCENFWTNHRLLPYDFIFFLYIPYTNSHQSCTGTQSCRERNSQPSHVVPVPHWLEGCFSGSNERHVIVEIPIQERRRVTLASISQMMKRFGALETEPEWLSSSDKSVSVHFKSPISARAAVNTETALCSCVLRTVPCRAATNLEVKMLQIPCR